MESERKLIPGVEIELAGEVYTLPPLTLGQLRAGLMDKMRKNDELIANSEYWEALQIKAEVITAALQRNYPDLSQEDVENMLDLRNYDKAWEIVLGGSGFRAQATRDAMDNPIPPVPPTGPTNGISAPSTEPLPEPTTGPTTTSTGVH